MLTVFALFSGAWAATARFGDFAPAIDVAFALSLAYSILLKLGHFSGNSLDDWAVRERTRVLAPLAEYKNFDAPKYERCLFKCRDRFKAFIYCANVAFVIWCLVAATCDLLLLILLPFHSTAIVAGSTALIGAMFLAGPLPAGLVVLGVTHVWARRRMKHHSSDGDTIIKFLITSGPVKVSAKLLTDIEPPGA